MSESVERIASTIAEATPEGCAGCKKPRLVARAAAHDFLDRFITREQADMQFAEEMARCELGLAKVIDPKAQIFGREICSHGLGKPDYLESVSPTSSEEDPLPPAA